MLAGCICGIMTIHYVAVVVNRVSRAYRERPPLGGEVMTLCPFIPLRSGFMLRITLCWSMGPASCDDNTRISNS